MPDCRHWLIARTPPLGPHGRTNKRAVDRLHELAAEKGITAAQLALAWLLARGQDIVPIPGTRTATRLEENLAAADVELTEADMARIDEIVPDGAAGARYTPEYMPTWV